jgi:hypothetical protein
MSIEVKCSTCGVVFEADDYLHGQRVACPTCGAELEIRSPTAAESPVPEPPPGPPPRYSDDPYASPPSVRRREVYFDEPDEPDDYEPDYRSFRQKPRESGVAMGLGIASLGLGAAALPLSWVCCVGFITLPVSGIGLALGIVGLILGFTENHRANPWAIAGCVVSFLAFLMPFFGPHIFVAWMKGQGH